MTDRTNADAVAELARQGAVAPTIVTTRSGRELLILPAEGGGADHFDVSEKTAQLAPEPGWIDQTVVVQTTDSLVDYVKRFAGPQTSLFADIDLNTVVAVIDYHGADAARVAHKATLRLPFSIEWQAWAEIDGKLMGQLEFARFLEENAADIEAPDGADLIEVCRDLQAVRRVNFTKAVRTATDNENFEYVDETTATSRKGGSVEIPSKFMLRIPVYFGGASYSVGAFLRWRLVEGEGLKLGIQLHHAERIRQAVFKEVVQEAATLTDRPAYFGRI